MNFHFPLADVVLEIINEKKQVENPIYEQGMFRVGSNVLDVILEQEGSLHISEGTKIEIFQGDIVSEDILQRHLSNWGLVGILHQRKDLNFHAAAIAWKGQGIMICGDSGAGKSSLTAALCLQGAQFISDDIVVIDFINGSPWIRPLENQLALRKKTLEELPILGSPAGVNPISGKQLFAFPFEKDPVPLTKIFWITPQEEEGFKFLDLEGVEKFGVLRGEICAWEMLHGMPETEKAYLEKLLIISQEIPVTRVIRNWNTGIPDFTKAVVEYMGIKEEDLFQHNNGRSH